MMKKSIQIGSTIGLLGICMFFSNLATYAQSGFSKAYTYPHDSVQRADVLFSNFLYNPLSQTFIFASRSNDRSFLDLDYWRKIDYNGNTLLHKTEHPPDALVYINREMSFLGNDYTHFLSSGIHFQLNGLFFTLFMQKIDTNLQTTWYKEYPTTHNRANIAAVLPIDAESNIIVGNMGRDAINAAYPALPNNVMLIKTDSLGNLIWQKSIDSFAYNSVLSAISAHDGNIILCGITRSYGIPDNGAAFVMKVDTAGNKLWHKTYNLPGFDGLEKMVATPDGNYVCVGGTALPPEIQDMPRAGGRALKIDEDGNVIWDTIINDNPRGGSFRATVVANNGDVVAFGSTYKYYAYDMYNYQVGSTREPDAWAVRLDAQGNEVWNRVFGHNIIPHAHEYLYNAIALPDGSFIAGGTTHVNDSMTNAGNRIPYMRQAAWLVKLDENGCMDAVCSEILSTPKVQGSLAQIALYPNPGNGNVRLENSRFFEPNAYFYITDMMGRTIQKQSIASQTQKVDIQIKAKASGIYFIRLQNGKESHSFKYVLVND